MSQSSPDTSSDAFPSTNYTMLGRMLADGQTGLARARLHVMDLYARPLEIYLAGSTFRSLVNSDCGADDFVRGFFADRLARDTFLMDWIVSRRPLRFWLITAFKHYLYEQHDKRKREQRDRVADERKRPRRSERDTDPEVVYHRELALWMVRQATERAQKSLLSDGSSREWQAAVRHHIEGRSYRELAEELGVTPQKAKVMSMVALTRFRRALQEEVGWPGATAADIDREIKSLMEIIQS